MRWAVPAPFRVRAFRFQWPADLLTAIAFEMETIILGWWVLVETGSVLLLTVYGALHFFGTLVAPMVGVIADRIGQRRLLTGMRAIYTFLGASLMVLALTGRMSPVAVFAIASVMAMVRASDIGVRTALVADMMPPGALTAAVGLSRTTGDMARIIGALTGASVFAMFGIGLAYVVITMFYLAGLLLTMAAAWVHDQRNLPPPPLGAAAAPKPRRSSWSELKAGLAYVWQTPHLNAGMWLAVLVNFTAFPLSQGLLPYVARDVYHLDKQGLGILVASFAAGALLGSLTVSAFSARLQLGRAMIVAAVIWYALLFAFAQMTSAAGGIVTLFLAGFAQSISMVTLAAMLLRTSDTAFRGRIMGVRMLATYSLPIGLLLFGAMIEPIGFRATASLSALAGLALVVAIVTYWRASLWPKDAPANQ